jgi:hypothetical protein
MVTDVQRSTDGGTSWSDIDYADFEIDVPLSDVSLAPTATITTQARQPLDAGDLLRVVIDGTTRFEGVADSGGTKDQNGQKRVDVSHALVDLFEETVTFSLTTPTDEAVLSEAIAQADGSATLTYDGVNTSLANDYEADDRTVKAVFRDMMDRTGRVWWVDPAADAITVATPGGGGQWQSLDATADGLTVRQFDDGSIETVVNDVTVYGTGDELVVGTASDATSISDYGRRTGDSPYNVKYITSQSEADNYAQALVQPDPQAQGTILVGTNVGAIEAPLVNQTVDLTDTPKDISATGLVIERQTIRQGRAELAVGQGVGDARQAINRRSKSRDDLTAAGSVYGNARLADDSVDTPQLVNTAVIEAKLADAAVATAKLENNAVINGKLSDLSVSETKIQDDSIATPKLQAEAVTAAKIEANTITAAQIAAGTITALEIAADTITASEITAGTITALEMAADTLTANEIDTLDLDAGELTISGANSTIEFTTSDPDGGGPLPEVLNMAPTGTGQAYLGLGNAWDNAYLASVNPASDNTGSVGSSSAAYADIYAHNYVTASPERLTRPDPAAIREADWYDNPPAAVRERAQAIGETDAEVPEGRDHTPVELGTMANWLLEATKAQQDHIDTLEDRVDRLERLVDDLTGGNA